MIAGLMNSAGMYARWGVATVLATGCWTSAPPPHVAESAPTGPSACKVVGNSPKADAHVSAAAGDAPFLDGFSAEKVAVQIARGVDGNGWLPLDVRGNRMAVRGFVHARELALYSRAPRIVADVILVGSSQRLALARGDGDGAEVNVRLPASVRLVDPARGRPRLKCSELSAFVATGESAADALGIHTGDESYWFATPSVAVSAVPGGPAVATLDTHELIADVIEQRGTSTRVRIFITAADDLAVIGWVPTASLGEPPGVDEGSGPGWGMVGGMGRQPRLRYCRTPVPISLVRTGHPGRVPVGEIAADSDVEVDSGPEVPPGTIALGHRSTGWLRLTEGAHLVIDATACEDQNRSPSSGP